MNMNSPIPIYWLLCTLLISAQGFTPCTIYSSYRGLWNLYSTEDGVTFNYDYDISVMSNAMLGFKLDAFQSLIFDCYQIQGRYLSFRSKPALLFGEYDVRVFMCWYLHRVDWQTYNLVELTDPVVVGSTDHAKAYLEAESLPDNNNICENSFNWKLASTPPFKQLRKVVTPNW